MPKVTALQWREVDIAFDGPDAANPYTDVEAWVSFTHTTGRQLRRPVFWDGGSSYRVRFASTQPQGEWEWSVYTAEPDHEFGPAHGTLIAGPPVQDHPHRASTRGFVEYFQYLDKIIDVLINHGITPVLQPVFHGFGWKGLDVAGPVVPPADYARYCRPPESTTGRITATMNIKTPTGWTSSPARPGI